jgi:SAM-dependent methyltransferase/acyl carrier protein
LLPELEGLSLAYVLRAFRDLGWELNPGASFEAAAVARDCGASDRHRRLLDRMLGMLSEEGILRPADGRWEVVAAPGLPDGEAMADAIERRFPAAAPDVRLLRTCGSRLADVVRGTVSPVALLFPDGDDSALSRFYQHSPALGAANVRTRDAIDDAVRRCAGAGRGRVLEVGAGTGAIASSVIPRLPRDGCEYLFTDVTSYFTERAKASFGAYPFVRFGLFDVDRDPAGQGYEQHSCDVVVASNVLHAAADLRAALRHVRALLRPGGALVLQEGTGRRRWIDLIFGLTDGWWRFGDLDVRADHPLIPAWRWRELLAGAGFGDVRVLEAPAPEGELFEQVTIVATAAGAATGTPASNGVPAARPEAPRVVAADSAGPDSGLRSRLAAAPGGERLALLRAHVRAQVAAVLGMDDAGAVDPELGFFSMGMDSLTSLELRSRLQTSLSCALPATVAIDYPTANRLGEHLAAECLGPAVAPASAPASEQASAEGPAPVWDDPERVDWDNYTEEELAVLLDQTLASIEAQGE